MGAVIKISEKDKKGEEPMLELLKSTGRFGKSDSRRVDEYLYGARK